ncbi:MAG: EF-hand domain-containing protein [Deltaproteobacteria bacterium]|nr:EF-hand domain-containing protein [Deltaproteobacteria bacterium]
MNPTELKETFDHFDKDGNGIIDRDEFRQLMQDGLNAEMAPEELDLGFSLIDKDGNGTIEFDEFSAWWLDR